MGRGGRRSITGSPQLELEEDFGLCDLKNIYKVLIRALLGHQNILKCLIQKMCPSPTEPGPLERKFSWANGHRFQARCSHSATGADHVGDLNARETLDCKLFMHKKWHTHLLPLNVGIILCHQFPWCQLWNDMQLWTLHRQETPLVLHITTVWNKLLKTRERHKVSPRLGFRTSICSLWYGEEVMGKYY